MRSAIFLKRLLSILGIIGVTVLTVFLLNHYFYQSSQGYTSVLTADQTTPIIQPPKQNPLDLEDSPASPPDLQVPAIVLPTNPAPSNSSAVQSSSGLRLKIPSINVDSALESVGVTPKGAVAVPRGPANAAWYDLGPRPGQVGSAVIVGHYGWGNGTTAVFDNLSKLRKGDQLIIQDKNGQNTVFIVRAIKTYDPKADTTEVFFSNDGKAHLNLITCDGVWDKSTKQYSQRLVVFADQFQEERSA